MALGILSRLGVGELTVAPGTGLLFSLPIALIVAPGLGLGSCLGFYS